MLDNTCIEFSKEVNDKVSKVQFDDVRTCKNIEIQKYFC